MTRTTRGPANHPAAATATPRTVPSARVPPRVCSLVLRSPEYVSSVEDVDVRATGYSTILLQGAAVFFLSWYFLTLACIAAGGLLWP